MTRKTFVTVCLSILIAAGLSSCKYPEGPFVSLQSATARVAQDWEVVSATDSAGNDVTDAWDEAAFSFEDDKEADVILELLEVPINYTGTWDLDNDETIFELDLTSNTIIPVPRNLEFEILRLTQSEFWLRDTGDSTEIRLEVD
ncbi:MAG: hypothetical protein AAFY71_16250 [Bacteroidota bacterium]